MKRKAGPAQERGALPSREDILAHVGRQRDAAIKAGQTNPGKIGKREIARAFGLDTAGKMALKAMLKGLEAEGAIERKRSSLTKPGVLPPVVLADIIQRDKDGELIAEPVEWDEAAGKAPRILIETPRRQKTGAPVPGVGGRALLRVEINREGKNAPPYTGRVIKLIAKTRAQMLGVFRDAPGGGGRILPVDKKNANRELEVPEAMRGEAQDGDLVALEIMREGRLGLPQARVTERLGAVSSEKAISLIAIHAHKIPYVFPPAALAEAERARAASMQGREDWRDLALITIDPADARDHDDAVHAGPDPSDDNPGGFIVSVAIADVAAYVRPGSALDREALTRGNSVYFPGRVVPMLPERISNDLCSLRPHEDRPALALRMTLNAAGKKLRHTFHRVMMRSAARLHYAQAQAAIDGQGDATTAPILDRVLKPLWAAYAVTKIARDARAPLDLDLPERKILLKPDGSLDRVITPPRLDAHRLIEEFMILANVAAAETLEDKRQQLIYRAHDAPSPEKLNALGEFLQSLGIKLAKGGAMRASAFNGILERVRGTPNEALVNEVVLRSQSQAEYVAENYGHFGLNLRRYAHFTSPIRRYADLIVHRALIRALGLGDDGLPNMEPRALAEIAASISAAERRAMAAERETNDRLIAAFLADRIGATFSGRIAGVTRAGLFIKLDETGADGFAPAALLGNDYFRHDEGLHALIGSRSGEAYRLGDRVEVKLVEAAPFAGALRFEVLSNGQQTHRTARGSSPRPRGRDDASRSSGAMKSAQAAHRKGR